MSPLASFLLLLKKSPIGETNIFELNLLRSISFVSKKCNKFTAKSDIHTANAGRFRGVLLE